MDDARLAEWAEYFNGLLPQASRAYGTLPDDDPRRAASREVDNALLEFLNEGGNVTHLSFITDLSLPGWRRRVRMARGREVTAALTRPSGHGWTDIERLDEVIRRMDSSPNPAEQRRILREAYESGVSLRALARRKGVAYHSLWVRLRTEVEGNHS